MELPKRPGSEFKYSNTGIALLDHLQERVSGATFDELVRERICKPLGVTATRVLQPPVRIASMPHGHDPFGKAAPYLNLQVMAPSGALKSNADDLIRYVSAQLGLVKSDLFPLMKRTQQIVHRKDSGSPQTSLTSRARFRSPRITKSWKLPERLPRRQSPVQDAGLPASKNCFISASLKTLLEIISSSIAPKNP